MTTGWTDYGIDKDALLNMDGSPTSPPAAPTQVTRPIYAIAQRNLVRFGATVLKSHRENDCAGLDGADLQELAVAAGLLEAKQVTEPCGEGCSCAGMLPCECFFLAPGVEQFMKE